MTKAVKTKARKKKETQAYSSGWMDRRIHVAAVAVLAFLLYSNSLSNGFVLDDSLVITNNNFTTKGIAGLPDLFSHDTFQGYYGSSASEIKIIGGRYRPLSVAFFAVLYDAFGANAFVFHLWNVLLYSFCCVLLYAGLRYIFEPKLGAFKAALIAGMATLIFVAHPVHTEVVNNIKSNDEILSLIFSLLSLIFAVKFWESRKLSQAFISGGSLFLACLAKENAVVFLAIIPLTLYFRNVQVKKKTAGATPLYLSLGISFLLYFIIRYAVLGWTLGEAPLDLINNPFIEFDGQAWSPVSLQEKLAMTFLALGKYLQLLILPLSLSTDYYPRYINVIDFSNPLALTSLLAYLALGLYAVYKLFKGSKELHVYGILFFLIALSIVSNLVFPIGTNLAERFLFMPSVGFCIVVAALLAKGIQAGEKLPVSFWIACVVLGFFVGKTFMRNFDFKDNRTLFAKDINVSTKSAKIQNAMGALIAEDALHTQDPAQKTILADSAMAHLNKALEIHPTYLEAFYMRGNVHFMLGDYEAAIKDYRATLQLNENFKDAYPNYALALREAAKVLLNNNGNVQAAVSYLEESLRLYPNEQETANLLEQARRLQAQ